MDMFATRVDIRVGNEPSRGFTITEKAPRRAFLLLEVPISSFKFEIQLKDTMLNRLWMLDCETSNFVKVRLKL